MSYRQPSSARGEHCNPCDFAGQGRAVRYMAQVQEAILTKQNLELLHAGRQPAADETELHGTVSLQRRHEAARGCAQAIFSGSCPLFRVEFPMPDQVVIIPKIRFAGIDDI